MKKLHVNMLCDSEFIAIITVFDYEILLSKYLKQITFEPSHDDNRRVLVDLALKSGIDQYRFVEFNVDRFGKIILSSNNYVQLNSSFENIANQFLKQEKDIVLHSILTENQKQQILNF
ncbi:type II toxin-antitoxin system RnlB family antitoxin [Longibaculum muris]|uniref:type II toxin-antitoxin system RnlB family antitoxin n=1 Tax=Longibaculum muris TaxID=1796628 RepID=UPI0029420AFE|nr:type II toxin-antitoxin system RnlB family antitoxin [Longibaculum muris]